MPRCPWERAYLERVIGTIRRECLDHVIVFNERSLHRHLQSFTTYYHRSRTHLALQRVQLLLFGDRRSEQNPCCCSGWSTRKHPTRCFSEAGVVFCGTFSFTTAGGAQRRRTPRYEECTRLMSAADSCDIWTTSPCCSAQSHPSAPCCLVTKMPIIGPCVWSLPSLPCSVWHCRAAL
jgi:hypothetical protein